MKNKNLLLGIGLTAILASNQSFAEQLATNTAQMQAMDKITGRVNLIDVPVNGEVKFGTFSIIVRSCKTNAEGEVPENYAFVDITDKSFDEEEFNIFKGWMLSSSPAVNAVEHPIYDVWLLKCHNTTDKYDNLLSEEQLALRDKLPRLQEIKQQIKDQKTNYFEDDKVVNINFKDSMYKEAPAKTNNTKQEASQDEQKPQNLLNITENFDEPKEEIVSVQAEDLSLALKQEAENLKSKETPSEKVKAEETEPKKPELEEITSDEEVIDDELEAAINAELEKHKD